MAASTITQPADIASSAQGVIGATCNRLRGKRVAMVTFSDFPDDPRPRRAISALVREGMQVDLICLKDGKAPTRERLDGIDIFRIPLKHRRGGKVAYIYNYAAFILISSVIYALRSLVRRYDLVYVHNMPDILVLSALIPKALGAKVILDLHDPMPELMTTIFKLDKDSLAVRLITRIEKWSVARADSVITPNIGFKRMFGSRSCRPEKIEVVMNSPDGQIFPFRAPKPYNSTNRSRSKRFVIMYHGSLVERNGLDLAVEALARVREKIPGAELRIYGHSSPFLLRILENARKWGIDPAIRYLGPKRLEELVLEIDKCDVGVIPNHRNMFTEINMPTRIFEYLALGKPAIAPRTAGIKDYFGQDSLIFFEAGDADDLADRIEYVFDHPTEVTDIVKRGQGVYQEHAWNKERAKLIGLVDRLLSAQPSKSVPSTASDPLQFPGDQYVKDLGEASREVIQ